MSTTSPEKSVDRFLVSMRTLSAPRYGRRTIFPLAPGDITAP
jgi:hypothetical protein